MREKLCQEDTSATTLHPPTCHANLCQLVLRQCETPASEAELRSAPSVVGDVLTHTVLINEKEVHQAVCMSGTKDGDVRERIL